MNSGQDSGAAAHVILHIGAGSFHRAHQAWYLHRLNEAKLPGEPHWSLTVGNIRSDMNAVLKRSPRKTASTRSRPSRLKASAPTKRSVRSNAWYRGPRASTR